MDKLKTESNDGDDDDDDICDQFLQVFLGKIATQPHTLIICFQFASQTLHFRRRVTMTVVHV